MRVPALVILACLPVQAQAGTLWQAWQAAQANDPAFTAARAQLTAAATSQPAALAALLPHFTVAASAGPQKQYFTQPELQGDGFAPLTENEGLGASAWSATLTQTLFNWSNIKTLQAQNNIVSAAAATYQANLENLAVTVTADYVAVMAASADLAALRAAQAGFAAQYHNAEARYRAGMDGVIGADEAGAAYQSIQVQVLQAQAKLVAARNTLAAITGDDTLAPEGSLPDRLALPPAGSIDDWLARAETGNPTLAANILTAAADDKLVSAARGGYLPNVSLQLQHQNTAQGGSAAFALEGQTYHGSGNMLQVTNSVTVQMNWNVFDGGATHAAADQAAATRDEAVANAASARLDVIKTIRTNFTSLDLDRIRLETARGAVQIAAQAVNSASAGVRAGLISESDLISDRQLLLSAQLALDTAFADVITDETGLAQAAGSATPAFVKALSNALAVTETQRRTNHD
jgi:outer membrane protein